MGDSLRIRRLERLVSTDRRYLFTLISFTTAIGIYVNLTSLMSPVVGALAFALYLAINAVFLGHSFFTREEAFFRATFGVLLLIMLLGFVGWIIMIIQSLDAVMFTLVLLVATVVSSASNRRMKNKNVSN